MPRSRINKNRRNVITWTLVVVLILILGGISYASQKTAFSDWPSANQNFSNTREVTRSSIVLDNVKDLGVAWSLPIGGVSEWGAATTNPLIIGNRVYFQDLKSNVYAVDLTTGKEIWRKDYNLDIAGPAGVSVDGGRLFAVKGHFEVAGLDLMGKELWSTNLSNNKNIGIDIQTTAYNGLVYVSTVPGVSNENFYQGGATGVIYALDQKTGKVVWSFDTVDSKDIWGNAQINSGGGAWFPPAIDTAKKIMYWGIGNPAPWPGTVAFPNGSSRPGNNLYTNSVVALEQKTGKLLWYKQVLPHDLFDFDLQCSPILANVAINGISTDVIFAAGKMGKVFAINQKTGELIWEVKVGKHLNDNLTALPHGQTNVSPGPLGGVETNMAYSDGMVYVPVINMQVTYTPSGLVGSSFNVAKGTGEINALEAATGKIVWKHAFSSPNVGAATVVNNVLFTSTLDGMIYAFDKVSGDLVWQYKASGGINGWPAVKGDTIIFPVGMGKTPALVAFKVGMATVTEAAGATAPATLQNGKWFNQ